MALTNTLPSAPVALALGIVLAIEILALIWCTIRLLRQAARQRDILESIAAKLSPAVDPEDIANPHAPTELLRLIGDQLSSDSLTSRASRDASRVAELSLGGYNKKP